MKAETLRKSILQQAIQGKLVPQIPTEEPASVLLEKIKKEKARLIKEKVIKKEKSLPEITEEEKPFAIPESWEWVRLGDVCAYGQCINIEAVDIQPEMWVLDLEDIEKESGCVLQYKTMKDVKSLSTKHLFQAGNILYSKLRPYLNKVVVAEKDGCCTSEILPLSFGEHIYANYAQKFLMSPCFVDYATECSYGMKMPRLGTPDGRNALFALPPLSEQHRIVARIEILMAQVDVYEEKENTLHKLEAEFPEKLKKSLLQYAIQGKLLPQVSSDGSASDLLEQIQAEKEKLIAEKVIKKPKALPPITEEEKPFVIPESWEWVRLGEVCNLLTDGAHQTPKYVANGVPFLSVKNISSGKISFDNTKFISQGEHEKLIKRCFPEKGDLLLTKIGTTGVPVIINTDREFSIFVSVALLKMSKTSLFLDFICNIIKSPFVHKQAQGNTKGVGNKNWVLRDIATTVITLPPLPEQQRIVARLNELMGMVGRLEKSAYL